MHKSSASSQPQESKGRSMKVECKSRSYHTVCYIKHILSTVKDWTRVMKRSHNVNTTDKQRSKGLATASRPTLLLRGDRRGWAWTGGVGCVWGAAAVRTCTGGMQQGSAYRHACCTGVRKGTPLWSLSVSGLVKQDVPGLRVLGNFRG